MLILGLLQITLAAKAQRTEGYLLRRNEVWKVLKSLKSLFETLIPMITIIKIYMTLLNAAMNLWVP
jgi:hypothetical protein